MEIVPQILSRFKISRIRLLALHKVGLRLQRPPTGTKPSLRAENSTLFRRRHEQKIPLIIRQNTPFQVTKIFFSGTGVGLSQIPPSVTRIDHLHPTPPPRQEPLESAPLSPRIPSSARDVFYGAPVKRNRRAESVADVTTSTKHHKTADSRLAAAAAAARAVQLYAETLLIRLDIKFQQNATSRQ